jgi:hypothetical protein
MTPQKSAKHVHAANMRWHGASSPFIRRCVCLAGHRVRGRPTCSSQAMPLTNGETCAAFRIVRLLGSGGMGDKR